MTVAQRCRPAAPAGEFSAPADPAGSAGLAVTIGRRGSSVVAEVTGEIDLRTAELLRSRLVELSEAGHDRLVVDFAGVRFCDATGLGTLVAAYKHVHAQGGEIRLARVGPAQRRLFSITGLDRLFALHDSVADAAKELSEPL